MEQDLCSQLAKILGGKGRQEENGVCEVTRDRKDIKAKIVNKPFNSVAHAFDFEAPDDSGNSLITGEMVLLQTEVQKTQKRLADAGIIIIAIHNHWLFDTPKLMYFHIESYMEPITFARILSTILNDLHE